MPAPLHYDQCPLPACDKPATLFVSSDIVLHHLTEKTPQGIAWRSCRRHEPDLCAQLWAEYRITLDDARLTLVRTNSPKEGIHMLTLPHTGLQVPHTRIRVTSLTQVDVGCGIAWSATLHNGKTRLGTIDNGGTGGMSTFHPVNATARKIAREFMGQCRDAGGKPVDEETVLDELTDEYEWAQDVARDQKKHRYSVRFFDDIGIPSSSTFTLPVPYPDYERALSTARGTVTDLPSGTVRAQLWADQSRGWVEYHRTPDDR